MSALPCSEELVFFLTIEVLDIALFEFLFLI